MPVRAAGLFMIWVLLSANLSWSQDADISVNSRPSSREIATWLRSGESRLVAWGAYFAGATEDEGAAPILVQLVEEWKPANSSSDIGWWSDPSIASILDALIVRNQQVSLKALRTVAKSYPSEAMILVSKLPATEAKPFLTSWYEERKTDKNSPYPRIAAMLLSKEPPPGLVASLIEEMQVNLQVNVTLPGQGFGGGTGGGGCSDGGGGAAKERWPPLFRYQLEENAPHPESMAVVAAGGDRISYRRLSLSEGWGECFYPRPLTPETRFHLLAEMSGTEVSKMLWQPRETKMLEWKDDGQYLRDLEAIILKEESRIKATTLAFRDKGLLTAQEAETVRPLLTIAVTDGRYPALPHLKATSGRTSISYEVRDEGSATRP
jgi:hypothetical protein